MLLSRARRSYEHSESSTPQSGSSTGTSLDEGEISGVDVEHGQKKEGKAGDRHRRSASSSDATPRPAAVIPRVLFGTTAGAQQEHPAHRQSLDTYNDDDLLSVAGLDLRVAAGGHNPNKNIFTSDSFFSFARPRFSSHQDSIQQIQNTHHTASRRLAGFLSSSPSRSPQRSHSHSRSDTNSKGGLAVPSAESREHTNVMASSVSSANTLSKGHTSPSKASARTYDSKLVSREMHRLGTLSPAHSHSHTLASSLTANPSSSTLALAPSSASIATSGTYVGGSSSVLGVPSGAISVNSGHVIALGMGGLDRDNPWGTLHVHVLPLFNEEPLRVPIEDLNTLVKKHIQAVLSASPSKALSTLENDALELVGAGMITLNAKLVGFGEAKFSSDSKLPNVDEDLLLPRLVEIWSFFWDQILPYVEGVLLPLQTDPLLSSLYRNPKQHRTSSPTRQGAKPSSFSPSYGSPSSMSYGSPGSTTSSYATSTTTIDVRSIALRAFRDKVVLPLHASLLARLSPPLVRETLLVLTSQKSHRVNPHPHTHTHPASLSPSNPYLHRPTNHTHSQADAQPTTGSLLRALSSALQSQAQHHQAHNRTSTHSPNSPRSLYTHTSPHSYGRTQVPGAHASIFGSSISLGVGGMIGRAPSFLSGGTPRDRRGRVAGKGKGSTASLGGRVDEDGGELGTAVATKRRFGRVGSYELDGRDVDLEGDEYDGGETPRVGVGAERLREREKERERGRVVLESLRSPAAFHNDDDAAGYHRASVGGWGLGAGSEEHVGGEEEEDDEDEQMDWDQAQAVVERMVGMKPMESPTETTRRRGT
ncbi:hypothetical protein SERLADRAFT_436965 [Serpula lacrymans var. lacrymans S7.9]|uniref:HbrB-domain-containing protein n=1 Tax=Serpula lacrymans var. lacrymans (strain S7.9) TaxID=578457 RepID=F8NUI8_SERL9|nr:uncharacterized protein SERLADRAFT_436965 [Serpula lacrymans var. lacrymans S7.9]EGO25208.1 hypothetical protein SERLADRAFT_436965 [Serpula lacrymans var. lacrymans S7.9]